MGAAKSWDCAHAAFPLHQDRPWSPVSFPIADQSSTTSRPSSSSSVSISVSDSRPSSAPSQDISLPFRSAIRPSNRAQVDNTPSPVSLRPHPVPFNNNNTSAVNILSHRGQLDALVPLYTHTHTHSNHQNPIHHHPQRSSDTHVNGNGHGHVGMPSAYHSEAGGGLGLHFGYGQQPRSPLMVEDYLSALDINGHTTGGPISGAHVDESALVDAARKARVLGKAKIKNELYKTEICRSYVVNNGYCKYGAKCQFAHGDRERRPVRRHPRYKTKLCRNFVTSGNCPYGTRCRFIHSTDLGDMGDIGMIDELADDANSVLDKQNDINDMHDMHDINFVLSGERSDVLLQFASTTTSAPGTVAGSSESPSMESPDASHMQELFSGRHANGNPSAGKRYAASPAMNVNIVGGRTSPVRSFSFSLEDGTTGGKNGGTTDRGDGTSPLRSRLPVFQTLSSGGPDGNANVVPPSHN